MVKKEEMLNRPTSQAAPAGAVFDQAMAAHKRGDFAAALDRLQPLAERGDAEAQYVLGLMHEFGQGVARDEIGRASCRERV